MVGVLLLASCIDPGGQAGEYCRRDVDCAGELVCVARTCRPRPTASDAGPPRDVGTDAGRDTGPPPMDAGPMETANVRLAYLIPDGPEMRLCIASLVGGLEVATTGPLPAPPDDPVPFRGITPYIPFGVGAGIAYRMKVYRPEDVETGCPGDAVAPVIVADIPEGAVDADAYATVALIGLLGDHSFCGPTLDQPCDESREAQVLLIPDDPTVDDTETRIRFSMSQVNGAPSVDFCHDPDGAGGPAEAVELFENVAYGEFSDYLQTAPITSGELTLHAHVDPDTNCTMETRFANAIVPNTFDFLRGQVGEAGVNIAARMREGQSITFFLQGVADADEPFPPSDDAALLIPWIDQPPPAE